MKVENAGGTGREGQRHGSGGLRAAEKISRFLWSDIDWFEEIGESNSSSVVEPEECRQVDDGGAGWLGIVVESGENTEKNIKHNELLVIVFLLFVITLFFR